MKCPNCGTENIGKYCVRCGAKLNPPAEVPEEPEIRSESTPDPVAFGFHVPDPMQNNLEQEPALIRQEAEPIPAARDAEFASFELADPPILEKREPASAPQTHSAPIQAPRPAPAPTYSTPKPTPAAPAYPAGAPAAPTYGAPAAPVYGAPSTPAYGAPSTPAYGAPAAPAYGAPAAPVYGAPSTPAYGAPAAPVYGAPAAPMYGAPAYGAPMPAYGAPAPGYMAPGYPQRSADPSAKQKSDKGYAVAHRLGSSPSNLIGTVAYTIYMLLFSIFAIKLIEMLDNPWRARSLGGLFFGMSVRVISNQLATFLKLAFGVSILFELLTAIGMWVTFGVTVNRRNNPMSTAGLTMIKVVTIIRLVFWCIFFGVALILVATGAAIGTDLIDYLGSRDLTERSGMLFLLIITLGIGVMVMGIVYLSGIIRTINAMRYSMQTGIPNSGASGFVAVMNFLITIGNLYLTVIAFQSDNVMLGLALLCQCIALCTFAVCIFQYRSAMFRASVSSDEE